MKASIGQIARHRSCPRVMTRPAASSSRNFAGKISRPFSSRRGVWVPRNMPVPHLLAPPSRPVPSTFRHCTPLHSTWHRLTARGSDPARHSRPAGAGSGRLRVGRLGRSAVVPSRRPVPHRSRGPARTRRPPALTASTTAGVRITAQLVRLPTVAGQQHVGCEKTCPGVHRAQRAGGPSDTQLPTQRGGPAVAGGRRVGDGPGANRHRVGDRGQAGGRGPRPDGAARRGPSADRGRARGRQDHAGQGARPVDRLLRPPVAVHPRPAALRHHRRLGLQPGDPRLRVQARRHLRQHRGRGRDQPGLTEDPVRAAGVDGGAPGQRRRHDLPAGAAVHGGGHPEPDRDGGHLSPARGSAGPLHGPDRHRLPDTQLRARHARAHTAPPIPSAISAR